MNTAGEIFLRAVSENKLPFEICKLADSVQVQNIKINPKSSSSPSEVVFGRLVAGKTNVDVSIKIFVDKNSNYNILGLKYEARLYQYITDKIINTGICPNFVNFIGYGECSLKNIKKILGREAYETVEDRLSKEFEFGNRLCVLLTEKVGSGTLFGVKPAVKVDTLYNFYENNPRNHLPVFFQIIYALSCLEKFNVMHNDLHPWNILVCEYSEEIEFSYKIKLESTVKYFKFKTRFVPFIYDFDFGYAHALGPNPKITDYDEHMKYYGNEFVPSRDLYILLCLLGFRSVDSLFKKYNMDFYQEQQVKMFRLSQEEKLKIREHPGFYKKINLGKRDETTMYYHFMTKQNFRDIMGEGGDEILPDPLFVTIEKTDTYHTVSVPPWFSITPQQAKAMVDGKIGEKINHRVFNLTKAQLSELIDTTNFTFEMGPNFYVELDWLDKVDADKEYVYILKFHKFFDCRPLFLPVDMPTPIEILLENKTFDQLSVPNIPNPKYTLNYKMDEVHSPTRDMIFSKDSDEEIKASPGSVIIDVDQKKGAEMAELDAMRAKKSLSARMNAIMAEIEAEIGKKISVKTSRKKDSSPKIETVIAELEAELANKSGVPEGAWDSVEITDQDMDEFFKNFE